LIQDASYAERRSRREFFRAKTRLELEGKQGREREAVPPRLPSGLAAGLDLDRLRGVFREPDGPAASGWKVGEVTGQMFAPFYERLKRHLFSDRSGQFAERYAALLNGFIVRSDSSIRCFEVKNRFPSFHCQGNQTAIVLH
jgi:hypothetical protein